MNEMEVAKSFLRYITKNKDTLYVICPFNIGDFLINGGLCHALLKKKHKKKCVLIERDRFVNSGLNFVGVAEIQYIPQLLMDLVRRYIYATREYENDNYIYGHFQMKKNCEDWKAGLIRTPNISFVDSYKKDVFGLSLDTELLPPLIDPPTYSQKQLLSSSYVLDKERTIILMPYANSRSNLEESFWTTLILELAKKNKDYIFYTNVVSLNHPKEKIIPGTAPMVITFQELMYVAEKVNCFIGLRSGIFDLLAFTNARLLYMYGSGWYDLNKNYHHTNSTNFQETDMNSLLGKIVSAVD